MTLTTEQAIEALNDMLAFEIDEFGGVPQPIAEEAVCMAINALRGEEPPGEWVQVHDNVWECPKCGKRAHFFRSNYCSKCGKRLLKGEQDGKQNKPAGENTGAEGEENHSAGSSEA